MINLRDVLQFIRNPQLDPNDRTLIVEALNAQVRAKRAQAKAGFRAGQKVSFYSSRSFKYVTGTIRKINRVNIDLIEDGCGTRWRVSPQLLKPVA
jgi:hypothetical protein